MARLPPELRHAGVYATSKELGFRSKRTEKELAEILSGLSAYDCMGMIGRLSAWYYSTPRAPLPQAQADAAFERFTGLSIRKFMAVGMAFSSSFAAVHEGPVGRAWLDIDSYFAQTKLAAEDIGTFLNVSGTTLDQLRDNLAWEEEQFGATTFGALAFERTPLLMGPDSRAYLISLESLERRVTEGILHILAEGAEGEGGKREDYTSPFGKAFQQWAAACFERVNKGVKDPPKLFVDESYGPKRRSKDTPDVVLRYPRTIVAAEIVSGPMQARTMTHGDLSAFEADLVKLVDKKAKQLTKRIAEILAGEAAEIGLDAEDVGMVWPVIITATSFPVRPEIGPVIRARLKDKGFLLNRKIRPVSIITAEEIAASEGTMVEGVSFVRLLAEWKQNAATGDHPFKNFLIFREREQRRRPAKHQRGARDGERPGAQMPPAVVRCPPAASLNRMYAAIGPPSQIARVHAVSDDGLTIFLELRSGLTATVSTTTPLGLAVGSVVLVRPTRTR